MSEKYYVVDKDDIIYPKALKYIVDPPERLYCMGNINLLGDMKRAAIVGSRKNSSYGKWAAETAARLLSENGIPVVSGLARGIDTAAHKGALGGLGSTIAVLGCGIDICYPAENRRLRDDILSDGLIVSEYPPGTEARKWTFPRRNRIIAGLSELVIVAEAGLNSGALITAEIAAEQGKKIMAIPGNINNAYNIGSNKLIYDGAIPVVVICDILEELGIKGKSLGSFENNLGDDEKAIYKVLAEGGEMSVDQLCKACKIEPGVVNGIVTVLEMKGIVHTSMGKIFVAK